LAWMKLMLPDKMGPFCSTPPVALIYSIRLIANLATTYVFLKLIPYVLYGD